MTTVLTELEALIAELRCQRDVDSALIDIHDLAVAEQARLEAAEKVIDAVVDDPKHPANYLALLNEARVYRRRYAKPQPDEKDDHHVTIHGVKCCTVPPDDTGGDATAQPPAEPASPDAGEVTARDKRDCNKRHPYTSCPKCARHHCEPVCCLNAGDATDHEFTPAEPASPARLSTPVCDRCEIAWGIIANAGGGDWSRESNEWQKAAARWRDEYHSNFSSMPAEPASPDVLRERAVEIEWMNLTNKIKGERASENISWGDAGIIASNLIVALAAARLGRKES